MEDDIGSIRSGKLADFVVLEENPYAVDPPELADIKIWGTVFEGQVYPIRRSMTDEPKSERLKVANPAAVFCDKQGGTYGLDERMCNLPNGDVVDAWTYYSANASSD